MSSISKCVSMTVVGFLIGLASFTIAQRASAEVVLDNCSQYEGIADSIMTGRQYGVRMSQLVEMAEGNKLVIDLVRNAYKWPVKSSEADKQQSIDEFANAVYAGCVNHQLSGSI